MTQFSSEDGFVPFEANERGAGFKIDGGFDAELAKDVSLYGNLEFQHKFDGDDHAFGGELGLKVKF